jgi:precorrin-6B methylase 2
MALNATRLRPLGAIKRILAPAGRKPRRIRFGFYKNLILQIDLQSQTQLVLGLWERECYPYLALALKRAHWMIDVGAGKGELCMVFMRQPRRIAVIAIEPNAADVVELRENLTLNSLNERDLDIVERTVSPAAQPQSIALDDVAVDRSVRGFLKIDVDGAEMDVLRSGEKLLSPGTADLLIETHSLELERDCLAWLEARGFTVRIVPNAWWRVFIPEYRIIPHNRWLWATSPNA